MKFLKPFTIYDVASITSLNLFFPLLDSISYIEISLTCDFTGSGMLLKLKYLMYCEQNHSKIWQIENVKICKKYKA